MKQTSAHWINYSLLSTLLLLVSAGSSLAQSTVLDQVESMAASGQVSLARDALTTWWAEDRSGASREDRQRALWLRGNLTVDRSLAEMDYHRLALEYPGGPYSARAVVRLGQGAQATEDWVGAANHFQRVKRDYPGGAEAAAAEAWLIRWDAQVAEARARARVQSAAVPQAPPEGSYAVQLGAFQSVSRAEVVEKQAREAGLEPRLVRVEGNDLIRIRVGWFETSREATDEMRRVRSLGLEAAVVKDADRETAVGR